MTQAKTDIAANTEHIISVDAMGGDKGPATVVAGLSTFLASQPKARAILHGPSAENLYVVGR